MINSPDFEAAKFWVGNLGKTATHAMVFAQLYTPDQACHGLHSFIVPVRPLSFSSFTQLQAVIVNSIWCDVVQLHIINPSVIGVHRCTLEKVALHFVQKMIAEKFVFSKVKRWKQLEVFQSNEMKAVETFFLMT